MPSADRIYLTLVHGNFEGDAFFPEMEQDEWKLISNRDCEADEKNPYALSFQVWERESPHPLKGSNGELSVKFFYDSFDKSPKLLFPKIPL